VASGGKWEDEEEKRFFEDIQDLKDFVPASVLGVEGTYEAGEDDAKELAQENLEREKEEVRKLEEELEKLGENSDKPVNPKFEDQEDDELVLFLLFFYFFDVCLVYRRQLWVHQKHFRLHSPLTWHLKDLHSY
jgi:hypothetical protein